MLNTQQKNEQRDRLMTALRNREPHKITSILQELRDNDAGDVTVMQNARGLMPLDIAVQNADRWTVNNIFALLGEQAGIFASRIVGFDHTEFLPGTTFANVRTLELITRAITITGHRIASILAQDLEGGAVADRLLFSPDERLFIAKYLIEIIQAVITQCRGPELARALHDPSCALHNIIQANKGNLFHRSIGDQAQQLIRDSLPELPTLRAQKTGGESVNSLYPL